MDELKTAQRESCDVFMPLMLLVWLLETILWLENNTVEDYYISGFNL